MALPSKYILALGWRNAAKDRREGVSWSADGNFKG